MSSSRRCAIKTDSVGKLDASSLRTTCSPSAMKRSPSRANSRSFNVRYGSKRGSFKSSMNSCSILGRAPALKHASIGGFDAARECDGITERRRSHLLAEAPPEVRQRCHIMRQIDGEPRIVLGVLSNRLRQADI